MDNIKITHSMDYNKCTFQGHIVKRDPHLTLKSFILYYLQFKQYSIVVKVMSSRVKHLSLNPGFSTDWIILFGGELLTRSALCLIICGGVGEDENQSIYLKGCQAILQTKYLEQNLEPISMRPTIIVPIVSWFSVSQQNKNRISEED